MRHPITAPSIRTQRVPFIDTSKFGYTPFIGLLKFEHTPPTDDKFINSKNDAPPWGALYL